MSAATTTRLRIFLADDHPIVRDGLRSLVNAQPDMEVVGEASDGTEFMSKVPGMEADVVVLDVSMPGVRGMDATERLLRLRPDLKVLALSAHEEHEYVEQMLAAGARGYVAKRAASEELTRAIRCVARGEVYLDPTITGPLVARVLGERALGPRARPPLSERESDVLRRVACGAPLKEIAASLGVSVRTVETYRARAMEKANLANRTEVIRFAVERGWLGR